ncbi:MAG: hypothetical protein OXI77_11555 [Chloroflexota bacterium]|nr:hypothetical protein [Chloroflexota bacterium]MDE2909561.1 hypothetical protein [Chloroflexota bacterium]
MEEPTKELKVPAAIYERAEAIAGESGRSAESVILDGLSLLFGELTEKELEPEELKDFTDEKLVAVVHQRLASPLDTRLRELMQLGQFGEVTEEEIVEMEDLVAKYDHQVLLRSEALLLLKRRGHDIDKLLKLGA